MKMTKQTKTILGIGIVGLVGYYLWKQSKTKKGFISKNPNSLFTTELSQFRDSSSQMRLQQARTQAAALQQRTNLINQLGEQFGRPVIVRPIETMGPQFAIIENCKVAIGCTRTAAGNRLFTCKGVDKKTLQHHESANATNASDFKDC